LTLPGCWASIEDVETSSLAILIEGVAGAVVLFYGRQLFWLFVGLVGFVFCFEWAPHLMAGVSQGGLLVISILVGVAGAVLAIFLQYFVVALAGLAVGASVGGDIAALLGMPSGWLAPVVGAVIGGILALALLDWGLVLLSSLVGAGVLAELLPVGPDLQIAVGVGLLVLGMAHQAYQLGRRPSG
jgi:hypothetical protein